MVITSLEIIRISEISWVLVPNGVVANEYQDPYYRGTGRGNLITFKSTNGAVYFKDVQFQVIKYTDQVTPANSVAVFASRRACMDFLKEVGFFDVSSGGGVAATAFRSLTDTFSSFAGRSLQLLRVNQAMTRIESFAATIVQKFTELTDTPNNILPGQYLRGNSTGTALVWSDGFNVNQNNIGRKIFIANSTNRYETTAQMVTRMNNRTTSISEIQTPVIVYLITPIAGSGPGNASRPAVTQPWLFLPGKGTYGQFGSTVTADMLFKLESTSTVPEDVENDPNAVINNIDPVIDGDFVTKANTSYWDFSDSGETQEDGGVKSYYFSYTDDGVLYYALFVGTPGEYGTGETPFTEDDFVTTTNSDVDSDPVNTSTFQFREKGPGNTGTPGEAGDIYWGDYYDTVASRMYYYPVARYTGTGDPNNPANHNWNSREYLN